MDKVKLEFYIYNGKTKYYNITKLLTKGACDKMDKMRQMFIDNLPKFEEGRNKGKINWKMCIGKIVNFIYDNIEGKIEIVNYNKEKISIKYENKEIFNMFTDSFIKCKLGNLLGKYTKDFYFEIGQELVDNNRDIIITDREYRPDNVKNWKWYNYTCNKCGNKDGWTEELKLKKGMICVHCNPLINTIEGINDIPTTTPWMIPYFQGGYDEAKLYTKSSNKKIRPICPDCGRIKEKDMCIDNIYRRRSIGCNCSDGQSYPNKFAYSFLEQLNVKFEQEYSPDWIKPKRYDNYFELNNCKYILEMDGAFHNKYNKMNKQDVNDSKNMDKYKDLKAIENNIEVIRIDCYFSELEYIKKNILLDVRLNKIFDLSVIDWVKIESFALSNLIKQACEYKKNNINITTTEIGNIMKLSKTTIITYLKRGANLGWCKYNPKEEQKKSALKLISKK